MVHTHAVVTGSGAATSDTVNSYVWSTSARETGIAFTPNTASPGTVNTTAYTYDTNGGVSSAPEVTEVTVT